MFKVMIQAILYKEWVKTRRAYLLAGALFGAYVAYAAIHTGQLFRVEGAVEVWAAVILKDLFPLPGVLRWLPLLAGLLVGLAQFVPEMTSKRLKLTLHLPLPERRVISIMLLHGVVLLCALFLAAGVVSWGVLAVRYPGEVLVAILWRALPWAIAGVAGYLFTAWTCIEPTWTRRAVNVFVGVGVLATCYVDATAGAYLPMLPVLAVVLVVAFGLPFLSAARFKEGAQ
jgi:hypothetical protein